MKFDGKGIAVGIITIIMRITNNTKCIRLGTKCDNYTVNTKTGNLLCTDFQFSPLITKPLICAIRIDKFYQGIEKIDKSCENIAGRDVRSYIFVDFQSNSLMILLWTKARKASIMYNFFFLKQKKNLYKRSLITPRRNKEEEKTTTRGKKNNKKKKNSL